MIREGGSTAVPSLQRSSEQKHLEYLIPSCFVFGKVHPSSIRRPWVSWGPLHPRQSPSASTLREHQEFLHLGQITVRFLFTLCDNLYTTTQYYNNPSPKLNLDLGYSEISSIKYFHKAWRLFKLKQTIGPATHSGGGVLCVKFC
jgi:hypothetical protein